MRAIVLAAVLLSLPTPAAATCHHFSRWAYPWPQRRCSGALHFAAQIRRATGTEAVRSPEPDIPLPSLTDADFGEGAIDDETRGRLLLRGSLEAGNAYQSQGTTAGGLRSGD